MASTTSSGTTPKFDWYETDQQIVLSVLVKNMQADRVVVQFSPRTLTFKYTPADESAVPQELNLALNGSISPSECSYRVSAVKAEIKMRKVANFRWVKLEAEKGESSQPLAFSSAAPTPMASLTTDLSAKTTNAISSAQNKMRNWEAQIKDVEKDEEQNKGVEDLFRQIYMSSSEEVRRAMNKSFQESNGTVLSTNWDEVNKGTVEMKPPESSEFKKW